MIEHVPTTQGVGSLALGKEKAKLCDFQVELYEKRYSYSVCAGFSFIFRKFFHYN